MFVSARSTFLHDGLATDVFFRALNTISAEEEMGTSTMSVPRPRTKRRRITNPIPMQQLPDQLTDSAPVDQPEPKPNPPEPVPTPEPEQEPEPVYDPPKPTATTLFFNALRNRGLVRVLVDDASMVHVLWNAWEGEL